MFNQTKSIGAVVVAVFSLASALPANANEIVKHTIPASLCEPDTHSEKKLMLKNGVYTFGGSSWGWAALYCPLPLGPQAGSPGPRNDIPGFRVYYLDSDGMASESRVIVRFMAQTYRGFIYSGPYWDSNNHAETGFNIDYMFAPTDLSDKALYYYRVRLYRANTAQYPLFSGIDFIASSIE